ncbi:MAG TPA: NifB/NifX family molybdenum-iron cluster-binding protein [Candidatus Deferrimicrobium sp.]|nr:NifB/NifX family molybdenum-iron cluster-binding protein [Candidatus Deferrimicrobium sp.]
MRIAVPIVKDDGLNSEMSGHFGQAEFFLIINLKEKPEGMKIVREENIDDLVLGVSTVKNLTEHACASLVDLLMSHNVDVLLVEGIGGRPFEMFKQNGVKVYTGAFGTLKEVLRDYLNGMLQELETASCGHHNH